jgi:ferritin-like metal-binding protein YciE
MALDSLQKLFVDEQIAAYGCLRAYGGLLGHDEATRVLGQTLSEDK